MWHVFKTWRHIEFSLLRNIQFQWDSCRVVSGFLGPVWIHSPKVETYNINRSHLFEASLLFCYCSIHFTVTKWLRVKSSSEGPVDCLFTFVRDLWDPSREHYCILLINSAPLFTPPGLLASAFCLLSAITHPIITSSIPGALQLWIKKRINLRDKMTTTYWLDYCLTVKYE